MTTREDKISDTANALGELLAKKTEEHQLSYQDLTSVFVTLQLEILMKMIQIEIQRTLAELAPPQPRHDELYK